MTYSHVSGDTYEIQLTVFRDCLNGSPGAPFDDPASIGIYDKDMILIDSLFIPFMGDDTLSPTLFDECLVIPPSVCVHRSTYRALLDLPPRIGGYELIYQRCCRNETINNIVDPLGTGASFSVVIKDVALLEKNSSPKFKEWPPIYICADEPILFDHSAIDEEGDSIVYRLCTPRDGGTPNNPIPGPGMQTVPEEVDLALSLLQFGQPAQWHCRRRSPEDRSHDRFADGLAQHHWPVCGGDLHGRIPGWRFAVFRASRLPVQCGGMRTNHFRFFSARSFNATV